MNPLWGLAANVAAFAAVGSVVLWHKADDPITKWAAAGAGVVCLGVVLGIGLMSGGQ